MSTVQLSTNPEGLPMLVKACYSTDNENLQEQINSLIASHQKEYVIHDIKYSMAIGNNGSRFSALIMFVYTGEE